ncbi:MAG: hypothetical protein II723_05575, partial [Oscillospiraceae bacterium]|nr:hypothetical protein [Oscillospiraceae bacterium]
MDEQKTPAEQDRSAEIAAAALKRLVSEGRLTPEEAERYRGTAAPGQPKQTAPVTASPADDLSPMLTPAEQDRSAEIAAAALKRLVSEGRLTPEEAERYRGTAAPGQPKQTAPVTASPAD